MKKILIFAGTTEGRKLSECLGKAQIFHTICVATEYGEIVLHENPYVEIHKGRMDQEEIRTFILDGKYTAVVDATHPYATIVTNNIKAALMDTDVLYLRLERDTDLSCDYDKVVTFKDNESCASALEQVEGNILLTTGSKELATYCSKESVKKRLYVRVLPGIESLMLCEKNGICGKQILALQGPFSVEMNEAILKQYHINCLVTKRSGKNGGYQEKIEAAKRLGISVYEIGHEKQTDGFSFAEVCKKLENVCEKKISASKPLEIVLAGVGMGSKDILTSEVKQAIEGADILLGAERMIADYQPKLEKKPYYMASQILPYLKEIQQREFFEASCKVVVLFSGDTGFYSGCSSFYKALQKEIDDGTLDADVSILPGISSVSYLSACTGESYQDAQICSMHGKEIHNLGQKIRHSKKNFLLMSGASDVNRLGQILIDAKLKNSTVIVGYQLSYPNQKLMKLTPEECCKLQEEGLYICLILNPDAKEKRLTHGKADDAFIRGNVPMTKEEVREVSICKLRLFEGAVVYDIGSGTGSIAIEIASLSENNQVYAIEQKEEAIALIKENKDKFMLENIEIVNAKAPEKFSDLPIPSHAFIGGSGGNMNAILSKLQEMNPTMRVVINAISLETICQLKEILSRYPIEKEDIVQMNVSRSKKLGAYHLMQAENPVWICSFNFREDS